MKKLLAGVTALVTVGATGCFGVNTATADESPIGEALCGKRVGDIVEVKTPGGVVRYEIVSIRRP